MLDICLVGTGGMLPLPNRFLTSLYVKCGSHGLLIDCGEGTQIALRKAGCSIKAIDLICITHFHADHISGLPGLLLSMGNSDRTEPVTITGPKGLYQVLSCLLVIAPELPFDIRVRETDDPGQSLTLGQMTVESFPLSHRIPCRGYKIEVARAGKFLPDRAMELAVPKEQWSHLQRGEEVTIDGRKITPDMVLGPPRKGIRVLYATDTLPIADIAEKGRNADLLILEGLYGDESLTEKARSRCHMTFMQAANLAREAWAKELWLTHFSPALTEPDDFIPLAASVFPAVKAGRDGMKTTLRFTE